MKSQTMSDRAMSELSSDRVLYTHPQCQSISIKDRRILRLLKSRIKILPRTSSSWVNMDIDILADLGLYTDGRGYVQMRI
jgi:hypothetical protein